MLVFVEQRHIDNAKQGSQSCPIALAAREQYDCVVSVGCSSATLYSQSDTRWEEDVNYRLDHVGRSVVMMFDYQGRQYIKPCVVNLIQDPLHFTEE